MQTTSVARVTVSPMDVVLKSKAVWNREPRRVGIMNNEDEVTYDMVEFSAVHRQR